MRVLFFGYSQAGYRTVELLAERRSQGDEVVGVVTHRDDPAENRWYHTPAEAALAHSLPLFYDEELGKDGIVDLAAQLAPDLVLSVFYRHLLPDPVLASARLAALNLHPSLLPAYRGRAPLNWVLVNGESETGVTLHHMVRRADAGDIVAQRAIPIAPRDTALTLYHKIEAAGVELLREALPRVASGTAPRLPQDESRASKVGRRRPEDGRIDWSWPAARVDALVRAVAPPWPGAFFDLADSSGHSGAAGHRVFLHAGEPAEPFPEGPEGPERPAPGTVRRDGEHIFIAAADRWYRVDEAVGLDAQPRTDEDVK
ncbi:MAG TPA: formyltransferase family protein [Thermoanaerobaculia bacterium]|nr:formyltransferase family protein [Thermoanaerobaculia bacterium]